MEELKKKDREIFIESYNDVMVSMELFMEHTGFESQKMDALMNYYQVAYKRV